jgi:translation initiation factor 2B subunit (eIF-2B alpha/beta/delta family)
MTAPAASLEKLIHHEAVMINTLDVFRQQVSKAHKELEIAERCRDQAQREAQAATDLVRDEIRRLRALATDRAMGKVV